MTANVYALVAAAGSGTRLGFDTPKAFVELNGRSLLERSLDGLAASQNIEEAIVLVSENMRDHAESIVGDPINVAEWAPMTVSVELGGGERFDSVYAGLVAIQRRLSAAGEATEGRFVAVHDAARCLTPPAMIAQVVEQVRAHGEAGTAAGVVPTLPVTDTIKTVEDGMVTGTPARDGLVAVQTPQGFLFSALMDANRKYQAGLELGRGHARLATDDASIMELADYPVAITAGDDRAMKITTPRDFAIAEMMVER